MKTSSLELKPDFARAQRYWDALWHHEILDRPCARVVAAKTTPAPGPPTKAHPIDDDFDGVLAIERLDAVQWVPGAGNPRQPEWPDVVAKIENAGKIIIFHVTAEEVRQIHGRYRLEQVVYDVRADSVSEGEELLEWLVRNS